MTLFQECLEALGPQKEVLSDDMTEKVFKSFTTSFPITKWGSIDWTSVVNRFIVGKADDLKYVIMTRKPDADKEVYILWDDSSLPSIRLNLDDALRVVDDVTAVSFNTWLYNEKDSYAIEFHHEGRITIGFV